MPIWICKLCGEEILPNIRKIETGDEAFPSSFYWNEEHQQTYCSVEHMLLVHEWGYDTDNEG